MLSVANRFRLLPLILLPVAMLAQQASLPPHPASLCQPPRAADFDVLRVFNGTTPVPLAIHCGESDPAACHTVQLDLAKPEQYQGDLIAPGNTQGAWTCAMAGGWPGWVPTSRLAPVPATPAITTQQWLGTWFPVQGASAGNRLVLTRSAEGRGIIHVEGRASYENIVHNRATGQVSGDAVDRGPFLHILDGGQMPDCVLDLKYDVSSRTLRAVDNQQCGGFNVTFDGVWRRR